MGKREIIVKDAEGREVKMYVEGRLEDIEKALLERFKEGELIIREDMEDVIDNLDIETKYADKIKAGLEKIYRTTIKIGEKVVYIGKMIISFILWFVDNFPMATLGLIVGAVLGMLIASIPIVGALIGGIATTILSLLGFSIGMIDDIRNKQRRKEIERVVVGKLSENKELIDAIKKEIDKKFGELKEVEVEDYEIK